jgi:hypothetical protein
MKAVGLNSGIVGLNAQFTSIDSYYVVMDIKKYATMLKVIFSLECKTAT